MINEPIKRKINITINYIRMLYNLRILHRGHVIYRSEVRNTVNSSYHFGYYED